MNKSKFVALFVGLAGLATAVPAAAQMSFYLGGEGGTAKANESICNDALNIYGGGSTSLICDRTGKGAWGGFMGLMFTPYVGVELGAKDLGTLVEVRDSTNGNVTTGKTRLGEANLVANLPVDRLNIFLKAGGYRAKTTISSNFANYAYGYTTQWTIGAGVSYDIFKHLGVRADYQRYNNVGSADVGFRADVDVGMVGVYLKF